MDKNVILQTYNLSKYYGLKRAVDNLNMTVHQGDIYGFVGLNGSGKTTAIRLMTGLIKKSGGGFSLFGTPDSQNLTAHRRKISSMVETPAIYLNMNASDNLKVQCNVLEVSYNRIPELLQLVGLDPNSPVKSKNFSLGMKQRLGIAMALAGDPQLMILDEPTNGLDPGGIVEIRELLLHLNRNFGITIIISSHILTELSKLANTYGFINYGQIIKEVSAAEIEHSVGKKLIVTVDKPAETLNLIKDRYALKLFGNRFEIDNVENPTDFIHLLDSADVKVLDFNTVTADLESYFINLIGGGRR